MAIYFKFKSAKSYDSISVDGPFISVLEFKRKVTELKYKGKNNTGLCMGNDFDIVVMNAQTNENYDDDNTLIPIHTTLSIQRVPGTRKRLPLNTTAIVVPGCNIPVSSASNSRNISSSITSSSSYCNSPNYNSGSVNCGSADSGVSPANEAPFGKEMEGATSKKFRSVNSFPVELVCPLCKKTMKDATFSKCCLNSFCDKCIRDHLILSKFKCVCGATDRLNDDLIPNLTVRNLVNSLLDSGFNIPQHQMSAMCANVRATHLQKPVFGSNPSVQPQTSASPNVEIEQPRTLTSASEGVGVAQPQTLRAANVETAVEKEAVKQNRRKRTYPEDVGVIRTCYYSRNSCGMNFNGYRTDASFRTQ